VAGEHLQGDDPSRVGGPVCFEQRAGDGAALALEDVEILLTELQRGVERRRKEGGRRGFDADRRQNGRRRSGRRGDEEGDFGTSL
jgi:hypothetical protein